MNLEAEKLIEMYTEMLTIRRFEEAVEQLFRAGEIPGFVHVYIGEEAVAVGVCAALGRDDWITSTHRGHGHLIAKGADLGPMMAELFGKETGYNKGRGGSMHIASFDIGILGANGIVAAGLPIAVGAGLACRLKGTDQVAVSFFGDGAANQGVFHTALNLASIWNLPVIFLCENNMYAVTTCCRYSIPVENIADRSAAYDMPGAVVDGQDVVAVYQATLEAVERARRGGGPSLIECKTYRYRGHTLGDEAFVMKPYRTEEEIAGWIERYPIMILRGKLQDADVITEEQATEIDRHVRARVQEAVTFARESPLPDVGEVADHVFAP
jgi:pyruvate dehydrogenase E1 component alpha subunit